ncbi:MAG: hypothetical protein NT108_03345 [Candidatus Kaiserbacteria bacterium]|nr:hypothetical protein [Candidatus Kaiserbacteria bacterium]
MCFSATASFVAGGALSAVGVSLLVKTKTKRELPLASIPLLFGIQQLIEGIVWLSFGTPALNAAATYAYSLFSHVLWPILVPFAVLAIETDPARKNILRMTFLAGASVGLYFLHSILTDSLTAHIVHDSIAYRSPHLYPFTMIVLYLVATCGSCLVSSHKFINFFGVVLGVSFAIAAWFFIETFFSVWCFFASILSVIIYWHFRSGAHSKRAATR